MWSCLCPITSTLFYSFPAHQLSAEVVFSSRTTPSSQNWILHATTKTNSSLKLEPLRYYDINWKLDIIFPLPLDSDHYPCTYNTLVTNWPLLTKLLTESFQVQHSKVQNKEGHFRNNFNIKKSVAHQHTPITPIYTKILKNSCTFSMKHKLS